MHLPELVLHEAVANILQLLAHLANTALEVFSDGPLLFNRQSRELLAQITVDAFLLGKS